MSARLPALALCFATLSITSCTEWEVEESPMATCVDSLTSGANTVECGSFVYDVHVPGACVEGDCGVVLDVHGATMDAQMEDNNSMMRALGTANGYIIIQPNAPSGITGTRFYLGDGDEMVVFTRAVIDALSADTDRVHMMGFSNGGQTTWEVYCTGEDLFASIAPAAAARGEDCKVLGGAVEIGGCLPTDDGKVIAPGVDVLFMAGTTDSLVDYTCSETQRDSVVTAIGAGAPETVQNNDDIDWTRYRGNDGSVFEVLAHNYTSGNFVLGGHCYPGSDDAGDEPGQLFSFACEGQTAFHWGQVAMNFFKAHPKNSSNQ